MLQQGAAQVSHWQHLMCGQRSSRAIKSGQTERALFVTFGCGLVGAVSKCARQGKFRRARIEYAQLSRQPVTNMQQLEYSY